MSKNRVIFLVGIAVITAIFSLNIVGLEDQVKIAAAAGDFNATFVETGKAPGVCITVNPYGANQSFTYDITAANSSDHPYRIAYLAFHSDQAGCGAYDDSIGVGFNKISGKDFYNPGETGTLKLQYNTQAYSCGRVQYDAGYFATDLPYSSTVFIAVVVNYGVDCMPPTPTPAPPTPTPIPPTPAPVPPTPAPIPQPAILSFTANPTVICSGNSSVLSWETSSATRVTLGGVGDVALDGNRTVSPAHIQTYRLTAYNSEGASIFRDVNVDVEDCTSCNANANISVSPSSIHQGESATVHWNTSNASYATINQFGSVSLSGSRTISPSNTTTYTINADDDDGGYNCSDSASATLTVTTDDIYSDLSVDKLVRNITNYSGSESNSINANSGDTVEFIIRIYVGGSNNYYYNNINNIRVYDLLPSGLSYISGSTTIDGNYTSDGIMGGGLYIGSRNQGSTVTIR
ncbi:MAG: hypothetical protein ABIH39_04990, partial [Candidatus Margulisiibacteriota bacterium]